MRRHPDLDITRARPDAVGPRPRVPGRRVRRREGDEAARHPRRAARLLLPHASASSTCTSPTPSSARWIQERIERPHAKPPARASSCTSSAGSTPPRRSRRSCRPSTSARSGSPSRAARSVIPLLDAVLERGRRRRARRGRHRHAAPRPAQRARQHRRQAVRADLPRVRGQHRPGTGARLRRREVPPRRRRARSPRRRRRHHRRLAHRQPVATSRPSTRCSRASCAPSRTCSTRAASGFTVLPRR